MGRQSSRLYYQGKDHKDIYFQGHYHDAMYIGNQLAWEKLGGKLEPVLYEDVSSRFPESQRKTHIKDMVSAFAGSVVFFASNQNDYARNGSAYLFRYNKNLLISGGNTGFRDFSDSNIADILLPDNGIYIRNVNMRNTSVPIYAFSGILYYVQYGSINQGYLADTMERINADGSVSRGMQYYIDGSPVARSKEANVCLIIIGDHFSQYFAGAIHAGVTTLDEYGYETYHGICSSTDGVNWATGSKVAGTGTVVGGTLFYGNGTAINQKYEPVTYTQMPAIYVNGWYYAEELDGGYLLRSKDLKNWQRYKSIGAGSGYTVSGYWRTKNLLCLKKEKDDEGGEAGIYKYKIHL